MCDSLPIILSLVQDALRKALDCNGSFRSLARETPGIENFDNLRRIFSSKVQFEHKYVRQRHLVLEIEFDARQTKVRKVVMPFNQVFNTLA